MKCGFAAVAALMLAAPEAGAQPPAAPPTASGQALDPAAVAAARDLLEATNFNQLYEQSARLSAQAAFAAVIAALEERHGIDFPNDLEADIQMIVDEHMESLVAIQLRTALDDTARVYARYFTASELRELQRLQTHPVMVRFQQFAPQFVAELAQIGVPTSIAQMPELMQRINEAVGSWVAEQDRHGEAPAT